MQMLAYHIFSLPFCKKARNKTENYIGYQFNLNQWRADQKSASWARNCPPEFLETYSFWTRLFI